MILICICIYLILFLSVQIDFRQRIEIQNTKIVITSITPPRRLNSVSEEIENFISNIVKLDLCRTGDFISYMASLQEWN